MKQDESLTLMEKGSCRGRRGFSTGGRVRVRKRWGDVKA
jgi:hypothetical protein